MTRERSPSVIDHHSVAVVIAHQNEIVKKGLEKILADNPRVAGVRSCNDWKSALGLLAGDPGRSSVLIVPRCLTGTEAEWQAIGGASNKVLLLLSDSEACGGISTADLWANGFLVETTLTARSLDEALSQLERGQVPMPSRIARSALTEAAKFRELSATQRIRLTHREMQTLQLIVDGLSNKQIAQRLHIGVNSVKRHVSTMLAKLNCPNRTKAAAYAIDAGLIETEQYACVSND